METTFIKNKVSKKTLLKLGMIFLILFIFSVSFFNSNSLLYFMNKYGANSNGINTVIIIFIVLIPLIRFMIPFKKVNSQRRAFNTFNSKRRIVENRRKKSLHRLMNANRRL